jgi:murein DD-endopeptidase MepM/ murein hydrolase activator NlpD
MNAVLTGLAVPQVGLPLVLIFCNAVIPAASRAGLLIRSSAIALGLVYLALAGVWLFPPWWTPWLLGALHLGGTVIAARRLRQGRRRAVIGAEVAAGLIALVGAGLALAPVIQGRNPPVVAIDLATPLGPGRYLVVSGGARAAINAHFMTLADRHAATRGQSYAVDIIGIDRWGLHADGIGPADPTAYHIYGADILAPCAGTVAFARDGLPDMPVPQMDRDNLAGNHVLLACGDVIVVLAHMRPGSVRVATGEAVIVGQPLGQVGNSGNTGEPHLHLHVQRAGTPAAPLSGEPLWFTIQGRFAVRNAVLTVAG